MYVQWVLAVASALMAVDATSATAKKDIELWQGTWRMVSMESDGRVSAADKLSKIKLTVAGLDYHFQNDDFSERGRYQFDAAKDPRQIDIIVGEGTDKGKIYQAIYRVQADKLTICLDAANRARPAMFTGQTGSGCVLEMWQRVTMPAER